MDLEILHDYLVESRELLQKAQEDTLRLESDPGDKEALASIFRAFHTIKGGAAFLEADPLVELAHDLEGLLDKLRSQSLPVTLERIDAILGGIDVIESMFEDLGKEQAPGPGPMEMNRRIRVLAEGSSGAKTQDASKESETVLVFGGASGGPADVSGTRLMLQGTEVLAPLSAEVTDVAESVDEERHDGIEGPAPRESKPRTAVHGEVAAPKVHAKGAETVEKMLRVDATRLDAVMNQVGELVLLRNRLTSALGGMRTEDENMTRIAREMDLRVSDLQNSVMSLRMQPCRRLFQQLPRVVRDASRQLGKEVQLEIAGEEVRD